MQKRIVPLFFIIYLIFGCFILPDYGVSWDEAAQRNHGLVSADYINEYFDLGWEKQRQGQKLETYKDRYYGVVFPLAGLFLERNLNLLSGQASYLGRHYLVFLLFWLATIFMFKMLKMRFKDWGFALLGVLLLILSPRIFSHSFYNPKDIVLLSGIIISSYTLLRFLQYKNLKYALLHGIACAFVINTRIVGILIPAFTILFLFIDIIQDFFNKNKRQNGLNLIKVGLLYSIVTSILTVLLWPYLWEAPLERLREAFTHMGAFPWEGDNLFYGTWVKGTNVPWYYTLAWLVATTPSLYTIMGFLGVLLVLKNTLTNLFKHHFFYANTIGRTDLYWLGLFTGALFIVAWKDSVLYNGWRQMYFIYPAFIALILVFLSFSQEKINKIDGQKKKFANLILVGIFILQLGVTTFFMVKYHPWQHLYFSVLSGKNKAERFEMDYWGTSYKQALEAIYDVDKREGRIKIAAPNYPAEMNIYFLEGIKRDKFKFVYTLEEADYYITNHYGKIEQERKKNAEKPFDKNLLIEFKIINDPFLSIYKLKEE